MNFDARNDDFDAEGMKRVCTPETALFICAIWSSFSKSDTARRPLMMKSASISLARSTTSDENIVMLTLPRWPTDSWIISSRSSRLNEPPPFCGLRIAATTTSSNSSDAVVMISIWPLWTGSNEPGYRTRVTVSLPARSPSRA